VRNEGPLRFSRDELITPEQSARVHDLARRVLSEIGLEVRHETGLARLKAAGFRTEGYRVFFDAATVDEHVDETRRLLATRQRTHDADSGRLTLSVSSYALNVHDIESERVIPFSTAQLVEMTKLMDSLADDGVFGAPPGIPADVAPDLQPIAQYRIAATTSRLGATPVDPTSAKTVNHLLDMADVMGRPITGLPVYMVSPLRLGGESLDVVLACQDRLSYIGVSSMPATGATAPVHPFGGLALAAAELIGGVIAVRALTDKPVAFGGVGLFPFDLRAGAMVFGSPENMLYHMLTTDFNRFYGNRRRHSPDNIHVMAKLPDSQSAAEKAAIMALGAFLGARHFSCAGTLSLDEIFSPVQLLADVEMRDWVERALKGVWLGEEAVDDWLDEIRDGVERGFMGLDSTLDHYREHTWFPKRFERGAIGAWRDKGEPRLSDRLKAEVRRRIASHSFELDAERRREIDRIYQAAERAVEE